jgi:hypothetical protein
MNKKPKTTTEKFLESLGPEDRKQFDKELRREALSEMVLAAMHEDMVSVRKLAKLAGVSPTIVQSMRSDKKSDYSLRSIVKVLHSLGFTFLVKKDGEISELDVSRIISD